jgi:transposase
VDQNPIIKYSESFKLQIVREIESGKHRSFKAAQEAYGIRGNGTVYQWVRAYGKEHLLRRVIRVETIEERDELRRLKQRVRELERALADAHLDLKLEAAYVELACEAAGVQDIAEFKKKHAGVQSTKR